jgi:hypothetical protein
MRSEHTSPRFVVAQERGVALIAALMIMLLMSALMIGFTTVVMSDQRYRGIDKDRTRAYYGAQSGLEKLNADFGNLFLTNVAPTSSQIAALANTPPTISGVTFTAQAGLTAYGVTPALIPCPQPDGTIVLVATCSAPIGTGPYQGLIALKKKYNLDAIARTQGGGEAHLMRSVESVAIPVFQFGMFSDVDLAFFAGPNFNFGGRVHTNGNLFLAEGSGSTLTLTDKVTAVGDVIRQRLQNGQTLAANSSTGTISLATAPNAFRNFLPTEGSLVDGPGSAPTTGPPNWHTISIGTYNGYIRNGGCPPPGACPSPPRGTGAKVLNLPLVTGAVGGQNTDLSRRPQKNEDTTNPVLFGERDFDKVSLRILLSDRASNITNLPRVTATAPVQLAGDWRAAPPAGYGPVDATHPPIARSPGPQSFTASAAVPANNGNISVAAGAIPFDVGFHVPKWPLTFTVGGVNWSMDCKAVTATTFTGCQKDGGTNGPASAAIGSTFAVTVDGVPYTLTTTAVGPAAGTNQTYTFAAGTTAPVGTNQLWLTDAVNTVPYLVTCTGVSQAAAVANPANSLTTSITGCTGTLNGTTPTASSQALETKDTSHIDGFIKIEMQTAALNWQDVTMEILNLGFSAPNQAGTICADPTPNAVIRIQRLKDNNNSCSYASSKDSYDYWPNALFDAREGLLRDVDPGNRNALMGGVMNYISLDVGNLKRWFSGAIGVSGVNALSTNGYSVYFSDRRNNVNPGPYPVLSPANVDGGNLETGEYGFEDVVNPTTAAGTPDNVLSGGEDVNANNTLDTYGQFPSSGGAANTMPGGFAAPYNAAANVGPTKVLPYPQGMTNRTYLFRRALKLVNGGLGNVPLPGFTVVTENPVYIQGDWNANQASTLANFGDPHSETSVVADAVTLLSNAWTDANSFANPYNPNNRARSAQSWYRLGIIAGKGMAFQWPAPGTPPADFGTDGGAHNFLRYLESGGTLNYRGAIATFYYSRQAVGTYKCCNTVYSPPTRNYNFDTDFLDPAKLPPLTPVFRDVNSLGFAQEIRPGK